MIKARFLGSTKGNEIKAGTKHNAVELVLVLYKKYCSNFNWETTGFLVNSIELVKSEPVHAQLQPDAFAAVSVSVTYSRTGDTHFLVGQVRGQEMFKDLRA